jgi:5-methylcytosine-specific restriction endonuclease McrA
VIPVEVFMRDQWHCQICGKPTPEKNRGTHYPNAPELDHRIPMSLGGGHLYSNVQCVCRRCNLAKSNRNCVGQFPLFQANAA